MAKFNVDEWYASRCNNHKSNIRVPVPGKDKPIQISLRGNCDATFKSMEKLAKKQDGPIPVKYPAEETPEMVGLRRRAETNADGFCELLRGLAEASQNEGEETAPINRSAQAETPKAPEKNGQPVKP